MELEPGYPDLKDENLKFLSLSLIHSSLVSSKQQNLALFRKVSHPRFE